MHTAFQAAEAQFQTAGPSLVERVAKCVTDFNAQLSSAHAGALSQVWLPEVGEDGSIQLNTQGLPYSINGTGDLLALFRCISCKYKFATDLRKPHLMGAVGRVFTSGEPEMSQNVQQYDKSVFLRVAEAQRCRISSALFMPLYNSPKRDCVLGVFEVVQTEREVLFQGVIDWLRCCLHEQGLYTADVDRHMFTSGLRPMPPEYNVSAFESGTAAVYQQQQQQRNLAAAEAVRAVGGGLGSMAPPRLPPASVAGQREPTEVEQPLPAAAALLPAAGAERARASSGPRPRPSLSDPTCNRGATGSGSGALPARPLQQQAAPAGGGGAQLESGQEVRRPGSTPLESSGVAEPGEQRQRQRQRQEVERIEEEEEEEAEEERTTSLPAGRAVSTGAVPGAAGPASPGRRRQPALGQQPAVELDAAAKQQPGAQQAAKQAQQAQAGQDLAVVVDDEEGEDEVMQPAKPLPPVAEPLSRKRSASGAGLLESSGGMGRSGTAGTGSHTVTVKRDSGRGSNTDKREVGSSGPRGGQAHMPSELAQQPLPSPAAPAAAAAGEARDGASPQQPLPPPSPGAAAAAASLSALQPDPGFNMERVGTSAHLTELDKRQQQQQQQQQRVGGGRPSSTPPVETWAGAAAAVTAAAAAAAAEGTSDSPGGARPSPEQQPRVNAQVSSAEATRLDQPIAATLAAILVQQQQQHGASPGPGGIPALLSQAQPPPGSSPLPGHLGWGAAAAAAAGMAPVAGLGLPPAVAAPAAASALRLPGAPQSGLPGLRQQPPGLIPPALAAAVGAGPSTAAAQPPMRQPGSAADLARMGSGGTLADLGRINSGGVGQKNLTLEDLQPHFGYGLKEAASRLGICPTTLKRTCRRLGISRWPRRQLVRLSKQQSLGVKLQMDEHGRPPSVSDGSGSGDVARQAGGAPPGVPLPLRSPQGPLAGLPPSGPGLMQLAGGLAGSNPALLLAQLQQQLQQPGGGGSGGGGSGGDGRDVLSAAILSNPALHQQLLQLQQQQQAGGGPGGPAPALKAGGPLSGLNATQLLSLAAGPGPGPEQGPQLQQPQQPQPVRGGFGMPLDALPGGGPGANAPSFLRSGSGALREQQQQQQQQQQWEGGGPWREPPSPDQAAQLGGGMKMEGHGSGAFSLHGIPNGGPPGAHPAGRPASQPQFKQQPHLPGHEPLGGPLGFGGSSGPGQWNLGHRPGAGPQAGLHLPNGSAAAGGPGYAELAAVAAAANLQHRGGGGGVPPPGPRRQSPLQLPNGFSLGSIPHLNGDHLPVGAPSVGSLDILAAADFDSVANSQPGISNLGGLSNLGLSALGVSNLDLGGAVGGGGLEFSVGGFPGAATSSQRP